MSNSGKVKCTCGWSWNKSDSSKKDMYICHECGRDNSNNMQNGGWLDSYEDGGTMQEHQENYNNSEVSLPEGFVGMGNNTKGRNYSPAWGGQFEDGGELIPMAQNGRATAADSLDVYNRSLKIDAYYNNLRKKGWYKKPKITDVSWLTSKDLKEELKRINKETVDTYNDQSKQDSDDSYLTKMYPNKNIKETNLKALAEHKKLTRGTRYAMKDLYPNAIDPVAPTTVVDTRIIPKEVIDYDMRGDSNDISVTPPGGSITGLYRYDPLSVKPWNMLTDAEKKLRVKKYGTDGVPKSYINASKDKLNKDPKPDKKPNPNKKLNIDPKPKQEVVQPDLPRVEAINLPPMQQLGSMSAPTTSDVVREPKSYNVSRKTYNMKGLNDYYTTDEEGVDYERAMLQKSAADAYNRDILKRYGPQNEYRTPKSAADAAERLKQLRSEVEITPNYQMGGSVYPVNYVPEAQMGASIPGAVGFSYARTQSPAPSNGKYAKKTMASAQNGQEMKYYQEGLDFKPKTISKDGAWLNKYDVAQDGKKAYPEFKKIVAKSEEEKLRESLKERPRAVVKESIQAPKLPSRKNIKESTLTKKGAVTRDSKGVVVLPNEQGVYEPYSPEVGEVSKYTPQSTASKTWEVLTNPLTAVGYGVRNQRLPDNFSLGDRSNLDMATDVINPAFYINEASQFVKNTGSGLMNTAQGNFSDGAVDFLGAGLNVLSAVPLAKGAKPLLNKAGRALGTESGLLSNAYKYNPLAFKPNESNYYRQVSKEAIDDALSSKLIREKGEVVSPENYTKFQDQLEDLAGTKEYLNYEDKYRAMSNNSHGPMPYFQKGELFYGDKPLLKVREKGTPISERRTVKLNHLIESNYSPENFQNSYGYKMGLGNPDEVGAVGILKPDPSLRDLENFNLYKKDWLQGYKQIPKQEDGGVIKDDMGQWNHPGEITEIGSPYITMQGVPYPVLGISDTGDMQMMYPEEDYEFDGESVTEYPMAKNGIRQEQKSLQNLDNLTNFTNYNKPQPGGWLNKYN